MSESPESIKDQSSKNSPKEVSHLTLAATEKMRRGSVDSTHGSIMSRVKNRVGRALSPNLDNHDTTSTDKAATKDEHQTSLGSIEDVPEISSEEPAYLLGLGIETVQHSQTSGPKTMKRKKNKHEVYVPVEHWTDGTF